MAPSVSAEVRRLADRMNDAARFQWRRRSAARELAARATPDALAALAEAVATVAEPGLVDITMTRLRAVHEWRGSTWPRSSGGRAVTPEGPGWS